MTTSEHYTPELAIPQTDHRRRSVAEDGSGRGPLPTAAGRLSIKKPRSGPAARRDPQKFHHNAASKKDLERIRESYREILGREVSLSLVVRRGLAVLAERLDAVRKAGAEEQELAALARHLR